MSIGGSPCLCKKCLDAGGAIWPGLAAGDERPERLWHVHSSLHTRSKKIALMRAQFWFRSSEVHSQVLEILSKKDSTLHKAKFAICYV